MAASLAGSAISIAVAGLGGVSGSLSSRRVQQRPALQVVLPRLADGVRLQAQAKHSWHGPGARLACTDKAFFHGECSRLQEVVSCSTAVGTRREQKKGIRAADDSDVPEFKGFPPMMSKPAFYWRMLAIIPYVTPLFEGWMYSASAASLSPLIPIYEYLSVPFFRWYGSLPGWAALAYFFGAYLGIVRNNRWPHFLRFHFITGMLLEIFLQVIGTANEWIPESLIWGQVGSHFWLAVTMIYLFTIIQCILCTLRGTYADIPFVADAAYMQIPYE